MGLIVKNNSSVAIEVEAQAGTYTPPADGNSYIAVKDSINPFQKSKETIESNELTNTVENTAARTGKVTASGEIPLAVKAADVEGDAPAMDKLLLSGMGKRFDITSSITKAGNTATVLQIEDADIGKYFVKQPIYIKEAGKHQIRTIQAIDTSVGAANITLKEPLEAAPADNVEIGASKVYALDSEISKTLSLEFNIGGKVRQEIRGARVSSMSLSNWTTGQTAEMGFSLQAIDLDQSVAAPSFDGIYSKAETPVILEALTWLDGNSVHYNEFGLSLENEIGEAPSAALRSGVLATSITKQNVSGKINPYMSDADVDIYTKYNLNDDISIFSYTFNPTGIDGEFKNAVAVNVPQAKITSLPAEEVNGNMTDSIEWKAHRDAGNDTLFIAFF